MHDASLQAQDDIAARDEAILKLKANHRLALTGTPVENRLLGMRIK